MTDDIMPSGTFFIDLKAIAVEHGGLNAVLDRILGVHTSDESIAICHVDDFNTNLSRYFRYEERMMAMVSYPLQKAHGADHKRILDLSRNALVGAMDHGISLDAIGQNLKGVFAKHEQRFDMVLNDYLKKKYAVLAACGARKA